MLQLKITRALHPNHRCVTEWEAAVSAATRNRRHAMMTIWYMRWLMPGHGSATDRQIHQWWAQNRDDSGLVPDIGFARLSDEMLAEYLSEYLVRFVMNPLYPERMVEGLAEDMGLDRWHLEEPIGALEPGWIPPPVLPPCLANRVAPAVPVPEPLVWPDSYRSRAWYRLIPTDMRRVTIADIIEGIIDGPVPAPAPMMPPAPPAPAPSTHAIPGFSSFVGVPLPPSRSGLLVPRKELAQAPPTPFLEYRDPNIVPRKQLASGFVPRKDIAGQRPEAQQAERDRDMYHRAIEDDQERERENRRLYKEVQDFVRRQADAAEARKESERRKQQAIDKLARKKDTRMLVEQEFEEPHFLSQPPSITPTEMLPEGEESAAAESVQSDVVEISHESPFSEITIPILDSAEEQEDDDAQTTRLRFKEALRAMLEAQRRRRPRRNRRRQ